MAIKVDLEKAYDRLHWDFISGTLRESGLHPVLCDRIMTYVSTASMNLVWNGEITQKFYPGRGLR